ncbi:MAG: hypothetical protein MR531_17100, partial [Lachnospiraceae bacterium]|nr:hypothetical protein [Lachnospiraceae bacterium]
RIQMTKTDVVIADVIFITLILIFILYKRSKNTVKNYANEDTYRLCIKKLQSRVKRPNYTYIPNPEIYKRFQKCNTDELTLTALAVDMLKHCGYKPAALYVRTAEKDPNDHIAGQYSINQNSSTIEIRIHPSITEKEILAILIHECMHFFLRCRGISMMYTQENEYLTDIAAVYMGFYEYMRNGYGKVGYLNPHELTYINRLIDRMQDE